MWGREAGGLAAVAVEAHWVGCTSRSCRAALPLGLLTCHGSQDSVIPWGSNRPLE